MTYVKIIDPTKRDVLIQQAINSRRNIFQDSLNEQLGEISSQQSFSKMFKPVTEKLESTQQAVLGLAKPTQALPSNITTSLKTITAPHVIPALSGALPEAVTAPEATSKDLVFGDLASKYISMLMAKDDKTDKTFGILPITGHPGRFKIGTTEIKIDKDDIIVGGKKYDGTPNLWELIMEKNPDKKLVKSAEYKDYEETMLNTKAIFSSNNPNKPRSSGGDKYNNILKPMWNEYKKTLPSKPKVTYKEVKKSSHIPQPVASAKAVETSSSERYT